MESMKISKEIAVEVLTNCSLFYVQGPQEKIDQTLALAERLITAKLKPLVEAAEIVAPPLNPGAVPKDFELIRTEHTMRLRRELEKIR